MGLGAQWHREALFVFAFEPGRMVSRAHPCEALSGLQQFNVEILLTPGHGVFESRA
jgi:hypothetical protein